MAATLSPLSYSRSFDAEPGRAVEVLALPLVVRVTAPNAGPYTFTGTNSFVVGRERVAVLDPGPALGSHLAALRTAIGGRPVDAIVLTHTHRDHSALVGQLQQETGAPVWCGPSPTRTGLGLLDQLALRRELDTSIVANRTLRDGEKLLLGDAQAVAVATPGHCSNHFCFGLLDTGHLFSGDHVMGWNSTVVAPPDGAMGDYLNSLQKLIRLSYRHYLPAHGGEIPNGPALARGLLEHREFRNRQVVEAVAAGARTIRALRQTIYPKLSLPLRAAASMTLRAHVDYLTGRGKIVAERGPLGLRLSPAIPPARHW